MRRLTLAVAAALVFRLIVDVLAGVVRDVSHPIGQARQLLGDAPTLSLDRFDRGTKQRARRYQRLRTAPASY